MSLLDRVVGTLVRARTSNDKTTGGVSISSAEIAPFPINKVKGTITDASTLRLDRIYSKSKTCTR